MQFDYTKRAKKQKPMELMTQEAIKNVSKKILDVLQEGLPQLLDNELSIAMDVISEETRMDFIYRLVGDFEDDPNSPLYKKIRIKLFEENRDSIMKSLKEEDMKTMVEDVLINGVSNEMWGWKWKLHIVNFMKGNWGLFENDLITMNGMGMEIADLLEKIKDLKGKLKEKNG